MNHQANKSSVKIDFSFTQEYLLKNQLTKQKIYSSLDFDQRIKLCFTVKDLFDDIQPFLNMNSIDERSLTIVFGSKMDGQITDFTESNYDKQKLRNLIKSLRK